MTKSNYAAPMVVEYSTFVFETRPSGGNGGGRPGGGGGRR